jgi:hypothetical protein
VAMPSNNGSIAAANVAGIEQGRKPKMVPAPSAAPPELSPRPQRRHSPQRPNSASVSGLSTPKPSLESKKSERRRQVIAIAPCAVPTATSCRIAAGRSSDKALAATPASSAHRSSAASVAAAAADLVRLSGNFVAGSTFSLSRALPFAGPNHLPGFHLRPLQVSNA